MSWDRLRALIESVVTPRVDLSRPYRCEVVMQHGDGSLDLRAIDRRPDGRTYIPDLTRVPVVYGEPGVSARVKRGALVYVEFAAGDPSQPMVRGWASGSVDELSIDAATVRLADGDRPIARRGDPVTCIIGVASLAKAVLAPKPSGSMAVTGYILDGSSRVKGS